MTQLDFVDDGQLWEAIDTLDRARTTFYSRTGIGSSISETERRERARRYLSKLDASIQGQNGSARLWRAACVLVQGFDLDPSVALELVISDFNARCQPEWSIAELQHACWRAHRVREREPRGHLLRKGRP
jgi:hypothetical protein